MGECWKGAEGVLYTILHAHVATAIHGLPRDIMDTFVDKMAASKDDPSCSSHDGKLLSSARFHKRALQTLLQFLPQVRNIEDTFRDLLAAVIETRASQLEWIVHFMAK